jgi:hypothetical protein
VQCLKWITLYCTSLKYVDLIWDPFPAANRTVAARLLRCYFYSESYTPSFTLVTVGRRYLMQTALARPSDCAASFSVSPRTIPAGVQLGP